MADFSTGVTAIDDVHNVIAKNLGKLIYLKLLSKRNALDTVLDVSGKFLECTTKLEWMLSPFRFDQEVATAYQSLKAQLNTIELIISEFCETGSDESLDKLAAMLGNDFSSHMDSPTVNDLVSIMAKVRFWVEERGIGIVQGNFPIADTPGGES